MPSEIYHCVFQNMKKLIVSWNFDDILSEFQTIWILYDDPLIIGLHQDPYYLQFEQSSKFAESRFSVRIYKKNGPGLRGQGTNITFIIGFSQTPLSETKDDTNSLWLIQWWWHEFKVHTYLYWFIIDPNLIGIQPMSDGKLIYHYVCTDANRLEPRPGPT